jgi:hypothetical protein
MSDHRVDPTQAGAEERVGLAISATLLVAAVLALVGVVLATWPTKKSSAL